MKNGYYNVVLYEEDGELKAYRSVQGNTPEDVLANFYLWCGGHPAVTTAAFEKIAKSDMILLDKVSVVNGLIPKMSVTNIFVTAMDRIPKEDGDGDG